MRASGGDLRAHYHMLRIIGIAMVLISGLRLAGAGTAYVSVNGFGFADAAATLMGVARWIVLAQLSSTPSPQLVI